MNQVQIIGRIVADPKIKEITSDFKTATFTVAVDRPYKSKSGEKQTDFITCSATNQKATILEKYFHKGSKIALTGEIHVRKYDDSTGKTVYITEVSVNSIEFIDKSDGKYADKETVSEGGETNAPFFEENDTSLPFDL